MGQLVVFGCHSTFRAGARVSGAGVGVKVCVGVLFSHLLISYYFVFQQIFSDPAFDRPVGLLFFTSNMRA